MAFAKHIQFFILMLSVVAGSAMSANAPPIFANVPATATTNEDQNLSLTTFGMTVFDTDLGSNLLQMSIACSHGTLSVTIPGGVTSNANSIVFYGTASAVTTALNTITYQPALHYFGSDTIAFTANDMADGGTNPPPQITMAQTNVTVNFIDYPPTITAPPNQKIPQSSSVGPLTFTIGDLEDPPANLTLTSNSNNTALIPNANIVIAPNGSSPTVTITPVPGMSGTATITLTATDSGSKSTSATFTVLVDDPPTISGLIDVSGPEGTPLPQSFTIGDTEDLPTALTVTATSSNQAIVQDTGITITPNGTNPKISVANVPFAFGTVKINVTVTDTSGLTSNGNFNATFTFVNTAPTLNPAAVQLLNPIGTKGNPANGTLVSAIVAGAITDPDLNALQGIAVTFTDNSNGTWQFTTDGGTTWNPLNVSAATAATTLAADAKTSIRFVPTTDGNYLATILLRAWDQTDTSVNGSSGVDASVGGGTSAFSTLEAPTTISVSHVNVAPTFIIPNPAVVAPVNAPLQVLSNFITGISFGPAIEAGQTVAISVTTNSNAALFAIPPQFVVTGNTATMVFLLAPNQAGTATIAIVAQDNGGTAFGGQDTSATQFITINTLLLPPVAKNSQLTLTEDVVTTGGLLATDPQSLPLTYSIVSNGKLGTAVIGDPTVGVFTYTPNLHVAGTDTITFKVNNGFLDSNIATVTIFIIPRNYPPTITSMNATPNPAGILQTVTFFAAATDIEDGTNLSYAWAFGDGASAAGSSVSHAYAAAGTYSATVTVTDSGGATATETVKVVVSTTMYGSGPDSNGDGVSDALEQAILAVDPNANPVPTSGFALHVDSLVIKLNFAKKNSDSIVFSGVVQFPPNPPLKGQIVAVDIGGVVLAFKLDDKLKAKSASGTVALTSNKRFNGFQYRMKFKGSFATPLAAYGLTNTTATKVTVSVPLTIMFGNSGYTEKPGLVYTATAGKSGSAKD